MPPKFVVDRTRQLDIRNAQLRACERDGLPLVFIEPGRRYATVILDMISIAKFFLPVDGQEKIRQLFREHNGHDVSIDDSYCCVSKVDLNLAEKLAADIYDIAVSCRKLKKDWAESSVAQA